MPVLIEDVTLVFERESLERSWPGGAGGFAAGHPEGAFCDDGRLAALTVRDPKALYGLGVALESCGLRLARRESPGAAVVHQRSGPLVWCPWLELARVELAPGQPVLAARAAGDERVEVALPAGWSWQESSSRALGVASLPPTDRPLRYIGREGQHAVYRDRFTGEVLRLRQPEPPALLVVECGDGARHSVEAEVVDGIELCALGLMHRESLAPDAGMLFRMGSARFGSFWMKNTLVPLDMLFLDARGRVVEIAERAQPMRLEPHGGRRAYGLVLEVNAGWVADHAVKVGDRVLLPAR